MRHGEAADSRLAATDSQRWLTDRGRAETRAAAVLMAARHLRPSHVYTSPFIRAAQTAEIVAAVLELECPIPSLPALVPGGTSAQALRVLDDHGADDCVLLVSHEPTVRVLSSHLASFDFPTFPTGGVAEFELSFGGTRRFVGRFDPRIGAFRGGDDRGP